jgi:RNA polymerase subunit RPABC4/transcription elongation factor Spt4
VPCGFRYVRDVVECTHEPRPLRVCVHLLADDNLDYLVKFTGRGIDCAYICRACAATPGELRDVCQACRDEATSTWDGIIGEPEIAVEPSTIAATHTPIDFAWPALVDLQPIRGADRNVWLGVSADGTLFAIDLDNRRARSRGPGRNAMPRASSCSACRATDLSRRSWSAPATTA